MAVRKSKVLSAKDKAEALSILSIVLKSGVSLPAAMKGQLEETGSPAQLRLFRQIMLASDKGKGISDAFDGIEGFTKTDVNLVKAAEKTGNLPLIFSDLALYYKKLDILRHKLLNTLFVPVLIFITACFIAAFPALIKHGFIRFLFESFVYICAAAALSLTGFAFFRNLKKKAGINKKASLLYYSFPVFGKIEKKLDMYNFSKILSLSISAGLGMGESLETSGSAVRGFALRVEILKIHYNVEKRGMTLTEALVDSEALGNLAKRMLSGGEISGTLQEMTTKLSDYLFEELDNDIKVMIKIVSIASTVLVALFLIIRILTLAGGIYSTGVHEIH